MKRILFFLLILLLCFQAAAESDYSDMPTEDLRAMRDAICAELAQRAETDVVRVDGLEFSVDSAYLGKGNDGVEAVLVLLNVTNPTDASKTLITDVSWDILQDGYPLEGTAFRSDTYKGPSAMTSMNTIIAPGIVDMKIGVVGILVSDTPELSVILGRKHTTAKEDPYCGMLQITPDDYR